MNKILQFSSGMVFLTVFSILLFVQSSGFSQTEKKPRREFRGFLDKSGVTNKDEKDFLLLDKVLLARKAAPNDIDLIAGILEFSDSREVVGHALTTIANLSVIPEEIREYGFVRNVFVVIISAPALI